ncbi:hypothetical protein L596_021929 [Steinernema carpocapsae]|uniref:Ig-like domain-containing protein n=1 Tax=Steinernema carpocapsae TaxID=34508 RepID=A0A4U5MKB1_STECR|nr:hypothetical protein L596_021929 [Steinernema carpocapsae]
MSSMEKHTARTRSVEETTVPVGTQVTISCETIAEEDNVTWSRDQQPLSPGGRFTTRKSSDNRQHYLTINDVRQSDGGEYGVFVSDVYTAVTKITVITETIISETIEEEYVEQRTSRKITTEQVFEKESVSGRQVVTDLVCENLEEGFEELALPEENVELTITICHKPRNEELIYYKAIPLEDEELQSEASRRYSVTSEGVSDLANISVEVAQQQITHEVQIFKEEIKEESEEEFHDAETEDFEFLSADEALPEEVIELTLNVNRQPHVEELIYTKTQEGIVAKTVISEDIDMEIDMEHPEVNEALIYRRGSDFESKDIEIKVPEEEKATFEGPAPKEESTSPPEMLEMTQEPEPIEPESEREDIEAKLEEAMKELAEEVKKIDEVAPEDEPGRVIPVEIVASEAQEENIQIPVTIEAQPESEPEDKSVEIPILFEKQPELIPVELTVSDQSEEEPVEIPVVIEECPRPQESEGLQTEETGVQVPVTVEQPEQLISVEAEGGPVEIPVIIEEPTVPGEPGQIIPVEIVASDQPDEEPTEIAVIIEEGSLPQVSQASEGEEIPIPITIQEPTDPSQPEQHISVETMAPDEPERPEEPIEIPIITETIPEPSDQPEEPEIPSERHEKFDEVSSQSEVSDQIEVLEQILEEDEEEDLTEHVEITQEVDISHQVTRQIEESADFLISNIINEAVFEASKAVSITEEVTYSEAIVELEIEEAMRDVQEEVQQPQVPEIEIVELESPEILSSVSSEASIVIDLAYESEELDTYANIVASNIIQEALDVSVSRLIIEVVAEELQIPSEAQVEVKLTMADEALDTYASLVASEIVTEAIEFISRIPEITESMEIPLVFEKIKEEVESQITIPRARVAKLTTFFSFGPHEGFEEEINQKLEFKKPSETAQAEILLSSVNVDDEVSVEEDTLSTISSITPYTKPEFVQKLSEMLTLYENEQHVFKCVYKGCPLPKVTWLLNDVPVEEFNNVEVINEDGVTFVKVIKITQKWTGKLECFIDNSAGSASSCTEINVLEIANVDCEFTFTRVGEFEEVANQPMPEDEIHEELQLEDGTKLEWDAISVESFTESSSIAGEPPVFVVPLHDQMYCKQKESIQLKCSFRGHPMPVAVWRKGDNAVDTASRYTITTEDGISILRIDDVTKADSDMFYCDIMNALGSESTECHLIVEDEEETESSVKLRVICSKEPIDATLDVVVNERTRQNVTRKLRDYGNTVETAHFELHISDVEIRRGERGRLKAIVKGNPIPAIEWKVEGDVSSSERSETFEDGIAIFILTNVQDSVTVTCTATNIKGSDQCSAKITVKDEEFVERSPSFEEPKFQLGLKKTIKITETQEIVRIKVIITGSPAPTVEWKFNKEVNILSQLTEDGISIIEISRPQETIEVVCLAKNSAGQKESRCQLVVEEPKPEEKLQEVQPATETPKPHNVKPEIVKAELPKEEPHVEAQKPEEPVEEGMKLGEPVAETPKHEEEKPQIEAPGPEKPTLVEVQPELTETELPKEKLQEQWKLVKEKPMVAAPKQEQLKLVEEEPKIKEPVAEAPKSKEPVPVEDKPEKLVAEASKPEKPAPGISELEEEKLIQEAAPEARLFTEDVEVTSVKRQFEDVVDTDFCLKKMDTVKIIDIEVVEALTDSTEAGVSMVKKTESDRQPEPEIQEQTLTEKIEVTTVERQFEETVEVDLVLNKTGLEEQIDVEVFHEEFEGFSQTQKLEKRKSVHEEPTAVEVPRPETAMSPGEKSKPSPKNEESVSEASTQKPKFHLLLDKVIKFTRTIEIIRLKVIVVGNPAPTVEWKFSRKVNVINEKSEDGISTIEICRPQEKLSAKPGTPLDTLKAALSWLWKKRSQLKSPFLKRQTSRNRSQLKTSRR